MDSFHLSVHQQIGDILHTIVLISCCNKELKRIATNYLNNNITNHLLAQGELYEFVPLCQIPCRVCDIVVSILFLKKEQFLLIITFSLSLLF